MTAPIEVERVDPRVARSRQAVLAAAAELLGEVGWGGVSIDAVSTRSGVARTTIYRHWPDLAALLADALRTTMDACPEPDTGTFRGDLSVILGALAATLSGGAASAVFPSMIDAAERDPAIAVLQASFTRERRTASKRAFERAVARGEIDGGYDFEVEAALVGGPLFYRRLVSREPLSAGFVAKIVDATCSRLGAP